MSSIEITDENFEEKVLKSPKGKFILKMEADWCGGLPPSLKGGGYVPHILMDLVNS